MGILLSSFLRTQVAAIFVTAIISLIPALNFSGLLVPVSSLSEAGRWLGSAFPAAWYQDISVGAFTKGLGLALLWPDIAALGAFAVGYLACAIVALKKQEA